MTIRIPTISMTKLLAVFRIRILQIAIPETQQHAHIYLFIRRILIHVKYSSFYSYLLGRYYNILFLSAFVLSVVISIIMETIERINQNQAKYFQMWILFQIGCIIGYIEPILMSKTAIESQ